MTERKFERLDPKAVQTMYLDEIAGRLADLNEIMKSLIPTGIVETQDLSVSGLNWQQVKPMKKWFSIALLNDAASADSIDVRINSKNADIHTIVANGTYNIDMKSAKIETIYTRATNGLTAILHLSAVR